MITQNLIKIVIAVVLTLVVTIGSGIVSEQVGLRGAPGVYAGDCTSGSGGGC